MIFTGGNYGRRRAGNGQGSSSTSSQRSRASREVHKYKKSLWVHTRSAGKLTFLLLARIHHQGHHKSHRPRTPTGILRTPKLSRAFCVLKFKCFASIWWCRSTDYGLTAGTDTKNSRQNYFKTTMCNQNTKVGCRLAHSRLYLLIYFQNSRDQRTQIYRKIFPSTDLLCILQRFFMGIPKARLPMQK